MFMKLEHKNKSKEERSMLDHEDLYEGYIMDLIEQLKRKLFFKAEYYILDSTGTIKDGHWTGAIKKLVNRVTTN